LHLVGFLSSYFAHDARSQDPKEINIHYTIIVNEITNTTTVIYNQIIGPITKILALYIQGAPLATQPGISLITLTPMKILQEI